MVSKTASKEKWIGKALKRKEDLRFENARTVMPSPVNPMGVKGVGEAGTIGATPAIVNAVVDALRPLGVRDIPMPLKRKRIWAPLEERRAS